MYVSIHSKGCTGVHPRSENCLFNKSEQIQILIRITKIQKNSHFTLMYLMIIDNDYEDH